MDLGLGANLVRRRYICGIGTFKFIFMWLWKLESSKSPRTADRDRGRQRRPRSSSSRLDLHLLVFSDVDRGCRKLETQHEFNSRESDWGFPSFMPLSELHDPSKGFLVNDTIVVEVDFTGQSHDLKKEKIICNADKKDRAEHLRIRLKKEHEEKEQKRTEKAEAHLYTIMKVARDEDLLEQIGRDIYFDLVDHDKVRSSRIQKQMPFNLFKVLSITLLSFEFG
ncbi:hypothetical protein TEA_017932 [Camellia sinensis var. sinensis]|uniref:MATH domain-containing protein n=1 Tax=Camellia sinensis var. sinensis TaxID=542762 RepID=A0A4S4D991_CAMSN|nr:hypothetical protein TEA_017932 [Camellia sinensis var. sinensis]